MQHLIDNTLFAWDEAGSGTPLVLLHGFPFHRSLWRDLLPTLASAAHCYAPDLRGCGESGVPANAATIDHLADDVAALIAHWKCGPVLLAGHSMGGYVGLAFARRHPHLLKSLVMVASRATADSAEQASNRETMAQRVLRENPEFIAEGMLPKLLARTATNDKLRQDVREAMNPLRPEGIANCLRAMASRPDSSALLGEITVPSLVIAGEQDLVVPFEESGIMAANFADGRLEVMEHCGHMPMLEQPQVLGKILVDWIAKIS
jgi:pimeloyl-ACP methyl ester carboxylesterase